MPTRSAKPKDIVARSITLTDAKGKARIYMGVLDTDAGPYSTICLYGDQERSIQISADQAGGLHLSMSGGPSRNEVGLAILADDRVGLYLYDHGSGSTTELGSDPKDGKHEITLRHAGKVRWTTKKKQKTRRTKAS